MNTQVTLIGIAIIIMIYIPIYFLNRTGYSYLKKLGKNFNDIALKLNIKLNQMECWGNTCIGIDTDGKKLLYNRGLEIESYKVVDLRDIKSSEAIIKSTQRHVNKTLTYQLESLDLKLTTKNLGSPIILNFYDVNNDYAEDFEIKRIEKWVSLINAYLTHEIYKKVG